ncbi:hypothetical protein QBC47DRAFT_192623 [Echria macrotheca]|uniref:Uncharacterized protein n=1 Tax=Echria macrotheca TaxID=438768 RepID=A0AAJ0BEJ2_9PEZI|nr:hypothetical protein QBC47DRAFT_192623 [Echria macrotheca]
MSRRPRLLVITVFLHAADQEPSQVQSARSFWCNKRPGSPTRGSDTGYRHEENCCCCVVLVSFNHSGTDRTRGGLGFLLGAKKSLMGLVVLLLVFLDAVQPQICKVLASLLHLFRIRLADTSVPT